MSNNYLYLWGYNALDARGSYSPLGDIKQLISKNFYKATKQVFFINSGYSNHLTDREIANLIVGNSNTVFRDVFNTMRTTYNAAAPQMNDLFKSSGAADLINILEKTYKILTNKKQDLQRGLGQAQKIIYAVEKFVNCNNGPNNIFAGYQIVRHNLRGKTNRWPSYTNYTLEPIGNRKIRKNILQQNYDGVISQTKSILTAANKLITFCQKINATQYFTADGVKKINNNTTTFNSLANSLSMAENTFRGFCFEMFLMLGAAQAGQQGLTYTAKMNNKIKSFNSVGVVSGKVFQDPKIATDIKKINEINKSFRQILNFKGGNGKADFLLTTNLGTFTVQVKSTSKNIRKIGQPLQGNLHVGGAGMFWSDALERADTIWGLKNSSGLRNTNAVLQLISVLSPKPYERVSVKGESVAAVDLQGKRKRQSRNVTNQLNTYLKEISQKVRLLTTFNSILGTGGIDTAFIYLINGRIVSGLQLAYQALIKQAAFSNDTIRYNRGGGLYPLRWDETRANEIINNNFIISDGTNQRECAQGRSQNIYRNKKNILNNLGYISCKANINLNNLTLREY